MLGAGGAVAGISNKSRFVFKCRDCGLSLSYPLGEPTKTLIDTGVASMAGRQTLNINGFPISWNTIKSKYPNIESGPADLEIEALAAHRSRNKKATVEYLMSLWRVDSADDEALLKKSEAELTAAQAEWEENKKTLETKKSEYLQTAMAERERRIRQLTVSKANELNEIQARIREAEKEIDQLRQQLSTFGIFKFSEKELEDIFDAFLCEMTQLPAVFISFTSIPRATRYYEPFLTETVEGQVSTDIGTITKQGTIYYEYNGI